MKNLLLSAALLLSIAAFSQKKAEVNMELHDGNIVKGTTMLSEITLNTKYGKLVIPVDKVNSINIGYGKNEDSKAKTLSIIKLLNSSTNEEIRKGAYNDLIKLGVKALYTIEEFNSDPKNMVESEYTGEFTLDNAWEEIKNEHGIGDNAGPDDVLNIENNYTIGGEYNFTKLDVKTEYGSLSVPKEKIKSIDIFINDGVDGEKVFKLMAAKHISGNNNGGWYKTGISLKKGQKFSISASGEVTLASLSNGVYKPNGAHKSSSSTDYEGGDDYIEDGGEKTYPTYGMVVYKIGDAKYENKKAGDRFKGTAEKSGMLYLAIYETVYNSNNKGSYTVKVNVGK